jgi:hypothetical protein
VTNGERGAAAEGRRWGREELLLLRQGTQGGKRPASSTSLVCCVEGGEWREALGEKTAGWGSSAAGFSGRHGWELDCSSFTGAMDPGSCCAMARPSWEMQRARGRRGRGRGRGHRALAGREEEQAWAPWEEGSRAPCVLAARHVRRGYIGACNGMCYTLLQCSVAKWRGQRQMTGMVSLLHAG